MMTSLERVDAVHVATVLEDCVDQLVVLGRIMPAAYERQSNASQMVDDNIADVLNSQIALQEKYNQVLEQKTQIQGETGQKSETVKQEAAKEMKEVGAVLRNGIHVMSRGLRHNPITADNLQKVQADRTFLEKVLHDTLLEMAEFGTFQALIDAVEWEKAKKADLQQVIIKEEQGRKRVKELQREIQDVKKEKEVELQHRNEMIAHLKDQLQEMKAKTNMEGKYIKKITDVSIAQTQKKCNHAEQQLRDEIKEIKVKKDEEARVNSEVESYLTTHTIEMQALLEHWMEKYDVDVEAKQKELDLLKASKARDLEKLQELTKLYAEYEQVVVEDRIIKEKARRKLEQEAEQLKGSIKLQSWWRGLMVRRGLGPYGKKKKKKGKGKKGKKGKGKKKK